MKGTKEKRLEVQLELNTYQNSKAELEADLRVKSSLDKAIKSLIAPIETS